MILQPNCSESVFQIDLSKFDEIDICKIVDELLSFEKLNCLSDYKDKDFYDWYVVYDEENARILLRARWEDEEDYEELTKILKKHNLVLESIGDSSDHPLFSYKDNFFFRLEDDVKVIRLNTLSGSKKGNEVNEETLKRFTIK